MIISTFCPTCSSFLELSFIKCLNSLIKPLVFLRGDRGYYLNILIFPRQSNILPTMLSKSLFLLAVLSLSAHTVSSIPAPSPSPTPAATLPVLQNRAPTPLPDKTTYFTGVSIPPVTISEHHFTYTPATSTCHPTVLPDKNGYVPPDQCNALYSYYPSFGAAILFSVLFGIVTVAHIIQAFFYKKV